MSNSNKPKIALWFRYGPADHSELFHAMPEIVEELARTCEVHYYGMPSNLDVPKAIQRCSIIHHLPFKCIRSNQRDKHIKTLLWILSIPFIGLHCRFTGIKAVYIDETVPLTAPLARLFYGPNVAFTVADMFIDIYREQNLFVRLLGNTIKAIDYSAWRKLPLIFTRAKTTRKHLAEAGVPENHVHPVYDPCDFDLYHPADKVAARKHFGFDDPTTVILVHHGILHPNKGNDLIIRAIADITADYPQLHYLLVGDGSEMASLKKLVTELKLEKQITITGWLPRPSDVNIALNAGDIGLVMRVGNESDDFHMTGALVHNMACALPLLAAKLGGVSEVVEEERNGLLFDPANMTEFKNKLIQLINSPEKRTQYGTMAGEDARRHFDMQQVVHATVQPLLDMINSKDTNHD